ncbi:MAG: nodulation protein NfeD [Acidobacteria bacterium]|nr:nodulation protein NfeD [Acidobacteriota bacterium]
MKWLGSFLLLLTLVVLTDAEARADVLVLDFDEAVQPASAELFARAVDNAERERAPILILRMRTPGGLASSMQSIVERIFSSKVPVVVYVAPSGANAASAGFVILLASDVAAMAPGTNTGAAHPVAAGLEQSPTLFEKVENDATAYVRSIAEKRHRNVELAEAAVRTSHSYSDAQAREAGLIEIVARDLDELVQKLNGYKVRRLNGEEVTLQLQGQRVVHLERTIRERLLGFLANPNIALILGAIGLLCLYFEFNHPGAIAPAVAGLISLVLALYGFHLLPINLTGVVLMVVALGLFIAEAKVQGFGILGLGGVLSLVVGATILIDAPDPAIQISRAVALAVAIPMALIMVVVLRLALMARRQKVHTGETGMIGLIGFAETDLRPEGWIFVRGELWNARSDAAIRQGEKIRVIGIEGLQLRVEPITSVSSSRQASVTDSPTSVEARSLGG